MNAKSLRRSSALVQIPASGFLLPASIGVNFVSDIDPWSCPLHCGFDHKENEHMPLPLDRPNELRQVLK